LPTAAGGVGRRDKNGRSSSLFVGRRRVKAGSIVVWPDGFATGKEYESEQRGESQENERLEPLKRKRFRGCGKRPVLG
jgi:hypothetical protein